MNANSIVLNAAVAKHLEVIPVSDLKLGMVVHAIAEQAGHLGVKSKGEVKHLKIIDKLTASGVKTVVVEFPALLASQYLQTMLKQKDRTVLRKKPPNDPFMFLNAHKMAESSPEYDVAANLLKKSKKIYAGYTQAISQQHSIDFSGAKSLVSEVYRHIDTHPNTLLCMSMIMQSSDYIANHSIHVCALICYFAQQQGYPKAVCENLALIGYLYDIGMMKVPSDIRNKTAPLEAHEQNEIQRHVGYSLDILAVLKLDREYTLAIEQHHERLNGNGYPNADSGSNIHKFSRMLAIVDCYDALTTKRGHKLPMTPAAALKMLSNPDYGYDQKLVMLFIRCIGVYPVGSLVLLSNKCIGLVTKSNKKAPTSPVVKLFYSLVGHHFISPYVIDLGQVPNASQEEQKLPSVIKPVLASQYGLNMEQIV